jgi:hypothetical protein
MDEFNARLKVLEMIVAGSEPGKDDLRTIVINGFAESRADRKTIHRELAEGNKWMKAMNGGQGENTKAIAVLCEAMTNVKEKQKSFNNWILGLVVFIITTVLLAGINLFITGKV